MTDVTQGLVEYSSAVTLAVGTGTLTPSISTALVGKTVTAWREPLNSWVNAPPTATITWNPNDAASSFTLSNGDRTAVGSGGNLVRASYARSTGKYYFEVAMTGNGLTVGLCDQARVSSSQQLGFVSGSADLHAWGFELVNSFKVKAHNGTSVNLGAATTPAAGEVVGVAIDFEAQKIWFAYQNTWVESGNPATGANPSYSGAHIYGQLFPAHTSANSGSTAVIAARTADFLYSRPSGFLPWDEEVNRSAYLHNVALPVTKGSISVPEIGITGKTVTASKGLLAPRISVTLSGHQLAASSNVLTSAASVNVTLSGVLVTAVVPNSISSATDASIDQPLAGVSVSVARGALAPSVDKTLALSGVSVGVTAGTWGDYYDAFRIKVTTLNGGSLATQSMYLNEIEMHSDAWASPGSDFTNGRTSGISAGTRYGGGDNNSTSPSLAVDKDNATYVVMPATASPQYMWWRYSRTWDSPNGTLGLLPINYLRIKIIDHVGGVPKDFVLQGTRASLLTSYDFSWEWTDIATFTNVCTDPAVGDVDFYWASHDDWVQHIVTTVPLTGVSVAVERGAVEESHRTTVQLAGVVVTARTAQALTSQAGQVFFVPLTAQTVLANAEALECELSVGELPSAAVTPAVVVSHQPGGFGRFHFYGWATQNNFIAYDGKLHGVGEEGADTNSGLSVQRRFGYALDQTTRGNAWGHDPWATSTWDSPGDIYAFDPTFNGPGDHYVGANYDVYDFYGTLDAPGGQFSIDLDGTMHFVHTRGYGATTTPPRPYTPDLVYYLQVADKSQKVWRRDNFTVDGQHELLMGVYGHTLTRTLVFYPTLSGSDWVPTYRVWDGVTLSSETQLTGFTGNGSCNAVQKVFCVTRAGYDDTIYVTYYSDTGHIGLIVMDAVSLNVVSHTLTARITTGSSFRVINYFRKNLAAAPPSRSLAEVVPLSGGTKVTQFLLAEQFVHLSWTDGTCTTPTLTLKTGPASSRLAPGWESLEARGSEVHHVVVDMDLVSANNVGGAYDYVQNFQIFSNDATSASTTWITPTAGTWTWTQSMSLLQVSNVFAIWFSGYGDGGQSAFYSVPAAATDTQASQDTVAWLDYWANQASFLSIATKCRVGRVAVIVVDALAPLIAGKIVTVSTGTLGYKTSISLALTGVQASVGRGTIAPAIGDIPVPLTGAQFSVQTGTLACTISQALAGSSVTVQPGALVTTLSAPLTSQTLAAASGALTPNISLALISQSFVAQSGLLNPELALRLSGIQAVVGKGGLQTGITFGLSGVQVMMAPGLLVPMLSITLAGKTFSVPLGGFGQQIAINLLGKALAIVLGEFGVHSDITLSMQGVQTTGQVGVLPTDTNVPKPTADMLLWARTEVEKLVTRTETDALFNDADEMQ